MSAFDPPLRGDALAEYMPRIKAGDTVSVEVTYAGHVITITSPCWALGSSALYFSLDDLLRGSDGTTPDTYVTALLAHEPTVVLPTGLHAVVRLTGNPRSRGTGFRPWTAVRGSERDYQWLVYMDSKFSSYASDEQIATVYAETLYEGIEVTS